MAVTYKTIDDLPSPPSLSVGDKLEVSHAGTSYGATLAQVGSQISAGGGLPYLPLAGGTLSGDLIVGTNYINGMYAFADYGWLAVVSTVANHEAALELTLSDAPTDSKVWVIGQRPGGGGATPYALTFQARPDDYSPSGARWTFARDGSTTLPGPLTGTSAAFSGNVTHNSTLAPAAGSATQAFVKASSTADLGIYFGTGVPTFNAAKGSLYTNTTATTPTTRLYVNTSGTNTWTNLTTAA